MPKKTGTIFVVLCAPLLFSCADKQFTEARSATPVVPVRAVINTLKCGLSKALVAEARNRSGISNAVVTLQLNVIEGISLDGSTTAGIPLSTGVNVSPDLSASEETAPTNNTTLDFSINIARYSNEACSAIGGVYQDAGFADWLAQVVGEVDQAVGAAPLASMVKYTYDSNFIIKGPSNAGAPFDIVPVKIVGSVDATRFDIQHIHVEIAAAREKDKKNHGGMSLAADPKRPTG
jgi:hypothetical protein